MVKELVTRHFKYFVFYYRQLGIKIFLLLGISSIIAFLDGIGLTLFVPLFQVADSGSAEGESLGKLQFVIDLFERFNVPLTVGVILIFLILLFVVKGLVKLFERYYATRIRVGFTRSLRIKLITGLCDLSYPGFVSFDQGRIHNVIVSEMGKSVGAFMSFFSTLQTGVTLMGYLLLAFAANFQFALFITLIGVLSNFIYRFINRKVEVSSLWQSLIANGLQSNLIQAVNHYKYLKATNLIDSYRRKLIELVFDAERLSFKMGILNGISSAMREPLTIGIVALVIYVQVVVFKVPMFSIILSLMFFYRSLTSLLEIQNTWQSFLTNTGGIALTQEMLDELKLKKETHYRRPPQDVFSQVGEIRFNGVGFRYSEDGNDVLKSVNLTVHRNQTVAFVGESGSGKTTMINLLAGLLMPTRGSIEVDGVGLSRQNVKNYRYHIGYITQEPVVFSDTLYNNVTFWAEKTPSNLRRFSEIIEQAALTDMVNQLPQREETRLGDNGILISGGQKQRISIARELFRGCHILLMDEATSSLDSETEQVIQGNINKLQGKYTIVIIAHRLSTVKNAEVIYLLDKGEITARGTFEELTSRSERFKRMVELQNF
ncbi:MAG: ABC transporter ATP-binding protein [Marinilabiliaceae bacterium]|nr:ABC transporter ATP-binding protein [Marinilabiliaceae bacterium]